MTDPCMTCELSAARDEPDHPDWDRIIRTEHWDLAHAFDSSHLGWLVLITRTHRSSIADLTDLEAAEIGPLTKAVSVALRDVTGCSKTYLAQFAEHPAHQHVHIHVVARTDDLNPNHRGPFVFAELGAAEEARVPEADLDQLAHDLRAHPALAGHQ